MSYKHGFAIMPCDTGQRITFFDRYQLKITWRPDIKDVRCKPVPQSLREKPWERNGWSRNSQNILARWVTKFLKQWGPRTRLWCVRAPLWDMLWLKSWTCWATNQEHAQITRTVYRLTIWPRCLVYKDENEKSIQSEVRTTIQASAFKFTV